jgi:hypothetical protein
MKIEGRKEYRLTIGAKRWQDECPLLQQMQPSLFVRKNHAQIIPPSLVLVLECICTTHNVCSVINILHL